MKIKAINLTSLKQLCNQKLSLNFKQRWPVSKFFLMNTSKKKPEKSQRNCKSMKKSILNFVIKIRTALTLSIDNATLKFFQKLLVKNLLKNAVFHSASWSQQTQTYLTTSSMMRLSNIIRVERQAQVHPQVAIKRNLQRNNLKRSLIKLL